MGGRRGAGHVLEPPLWLHRLDGPHEMVEVAQGIFPLPLAGGAVAEHDVVAVITEIWAAVAELVADQLNVLRQSGPEQPTRTRAEGIGIGFQGLRRAAFGLDADGIKRRCRVRAARPAFLAPRRAVPWPADKCPCSSYR